MALKLILPAEITLRNLLIISPVGKKFKWQQKETVKNHKYQKHNNQLLKSYIVISPTLNHNLLQIICTGGIKTELLLSHFPSLRCYC